MLTVSWIWNIWFHFSFCANVCHQLSPSPSRHCSSRTVSPSDVIYRSGMCRVLYCVCVRQAVVVFSSAAPPPLPQLANLSGLPETRRRGVECDTMRSDDFEEMPLQRLLTTFILLTTLVGVHFGFIELSLFFIYWIFFFSHTVSTYCIDQFSFPPSSFCLLRIGTSLWPHLHLHCMVAGEPNFSFWCHSVLYILTESVLNLHFLLDISHIWCFLL